MEWLEAFQNERKQRISFYQELLADNRRITLEMGDNCQVREIYTVLLYSHNEYASELSASERNITLSLFKKLEQQLNGDSISLPNWFALSESQWSFAERSVLLGDEASCVQQIEICEQLNHPNVCKFYGAYHVGRTPFVVLDETVAFSAKLSFENKDVWRLLLGYAYGLQYILSRGLAYTSLSLADFRVTWDGKPVLSSIGLVHQAIDHLDDTKREQSAASNVLAFGLIVFQILALKHLSTKAVRDLSKDDSPKLQYVQELSIEWHRVMRKRNWPPRLEIGAASNDIQADIVGVSNEMTEDEWNLLRSLCKITSANRTDVAKFISKMNELTQAREAPGTRVKKAPAKVLKDVNEVICSSSGLKLKNLLAEIEEELEEISDQFREDNRRVMNRLLDIYRQLENPAGPLLAAVVEDFVGLVQGYHIQVSRRLENSDFSANYVMMSSVALTVADRNESTHHLLDELMRKSCCLSDKSAVHQWQEHSRNHQIMDTVLEDEEADYDTSGGSPRWLLPTDEVQLLKRIAHGAFGAAYWGKWLDMDVVVKKVLTNQQESRNREQFRHEVELWFSLNHANVIKLYGACHENNKQPVFVCEQAIHGTLSSFLKDKPAEAIWGALYTAAQGLRHLHERGIVHGDLKGNKVLVCDNNFVKLADFGLSAIAKPVLTPVDKPGSIGAIRWRAPECIQGFMPTFASDIYSFGMCIVEVVTGKFPWGSIPDPFVIRHVVDEKLLPAGLEAFDRDEGKLVKRMCQYDPNDRIDIGAVVCLLYQLYSGSDSLNRSAEQDAQYTEAVALQRFMALRRREMPSDRGGELPEWFIPSHQVELVHHIDDGIFASVWEARCGGVVAVKSLRKRYEKTQDTFPRQVKMWYALNHPNIVHLYGACHVGNPFYVCEMATNGCLTDYLKKKENQAQVWHCLLDVALGLQYLHSCGVIHGNLKGNAYLVFDSGKTKVGSCEWSVFAGSKDIYDGDHGALGWMAPEVLDGGNPSFAADIYSFGMCVIEALTGTYPWGTMTDVVVKYQVSRGELPPRPAKMNDWEWELVKRMCRFDPNSRISVDAVVCYIMAGMNGTAAASSNAAGLFAKLEDMHRDIPSTADVVAGTKQQVSACSDHSSVPLLIQRLSSDDKTPQQKEEALLDLLLMCVTNSNRVHVYKTKGIPVLTNLVRKGGTFPSQLYALHGLRWFTFSFFKLRESEFESLLGCVREPTHTEMLSLLHELQCDDDEVKERAALQCSCMATGGAGDTLRRVGVLPLLGLLENGTANQKLWATEALATLASDSDENCVAITRGGAIPPLVGLLRSGTDMHKQEAAYALGNLAANNDENRSKIAREGAIPPMVAFMKSVADSQNQWAVYALGCLAFNNEENRVLIAQEGAIPPLVHLLRVGTRAHKQWSAYSLGNLALSNANREEITLKGAIRPLVNLLRVGTLAQKKWSAHTLGNLAHSDANREEIMLEGAIARLIELLRTGTAMQKQRAAFALGNLACGNNTTTNFDGAILPLVDLVRMGSDTQKEDAAYILGNLAATNDSRRAKIGRQGAIAPLVKLLKTGDGEQKQWAAFALRCLAYDNDLNRVAIVEEGAVEPLAAMAEEGTEEQKEEAAHALEHLVVKENDATANTFIPDRTMARY